MRKASVIPAAVVAAVFVLGFPGSAAGARGHRRVATHASKAKSPRVHRKQSAASARRPSAAHSARPAHREDASVSIDRVAVEVPQFYGPFLPVETYDYPQPPCAELDAVLEAHVHDAAEETPETQRVADGVEPAHASALTRVARTLSGLLRPKSAETTVRPEDVDLSDLLSAGVQIPVEGVDSSRLRDSFLASRGSHRQHLAIDIGAPRGTPVLAAADGEVVQLRREKRGGISLYQKDKSGRYLLFYCHLTRYAKGLRPGQTVSKGDVIAYVGRTGHVIGGPHLHFSITRLPEDDDNFKAGIAINPYLLFLAAVP